VLVFMESEHQRFCEEWIEAMRQRIEVWGIEDVGPIDAVEIPNEVERTFGIIRQRIDTLLTGLGLCADGPATSFPRAEKIAESRGSSDLSRQRLAQNDQSILP
jgi:hypothetical protein